MKKLGSSLMVFVAGCLGGQSGTPTPAIPDPGCVAVAQTPIADWSEPEALFMPTTGRWSGECDGQALVISLPMLNAETATGEGVNNEWNAFGAEGVTPRECRDGYALRFGADIELAGGLQPFDMSAAHGRYVESYDGMPAELDRYSRAWLEVFGQATFDESDASEFSMPLEGGPVAVSAAISALLSEDGTELQGSIEWFGYAEDAQTPVTPPGGPDDGTDPSNPRPGPVAEEPAMLISTCTFTLRRD
ncbi:MAG: hypothetical protein ACI9KE_004873 [Polyangiales bacterium]|jgi:hypothetical protein